MRIARMSSRLRRVSFPSSSVSLPGTAFALASGGFASSLNFAAVCPGSSSQKVAKTTHPLQCTPRLRCTVDSRLQPFSGRGRIYFGWTTAGKAAQLLSLQRCSRPFAAAVVS